MNWFGIIVGAIALAAVVYFLRKDACGCGGGCCCAGKASKMPLDDDPLDATDDSDENRPVTPPDPNRCDNCETASGCGLFSGTTMYKSCSGLAITFPKNCPMAEGEDAGNDETK